ncbi:MAG: GMP/IMP nucleotidase [Magnetococcales bacterium]|nr:GMP/IMP nucleotidase [Magnetococcales bacterium]
MPPPLLEWPGIRTVLLDMDGTLLDRHFDDHFFLHTVPEAYAKVHGLSQHHARQEVLAAYHRVEGTLAWYDLDHWSRTLALDIPALKREVAHLISPRPHALEFMDLVKRSGRRACLVTNAHPRSLALKLERTPIGRHLDAILTSHQVGHAKEDRRFWEAARRLLGFDPGDSLLADDSEPILVTAAAWGIGHLLHIAHPSSALPPVFSQRFVSVADFRPVLPIPF